MATYQHEIFTVEHVHTLEVQLQTIFVPYNTVMIECMHIESVARYTTVKLQQNVFILHYI